VSAEATSVVEQFNEALAERGEIAWNLIDPEIVVVDHDIPDAGDYHGHEGFRKWLLEDWASAWESYTLEDGQFVDAGDTVVSVFTLTARGKGSGVETRRRNATVNSIKNGRITRIEYFTTEEEARAAAGLTPAEQSQR
jgi:ketosteroid isomerase-like protein